MNNDLNERLFLKIKIELKQLKIKVFHIFNVMDTSTVISQIGNTPLVRLKQASELTGCNIYGKAEYLNPGESVKIELRFILSKMH